MSDIQIEIPREYICPITLTIMEDPVICEDGQTYERISIMMLSNSISPITRQYINKNNLIPNRAIKDAIERFKLTNTYNGLGQITHSTSQVFISNPQLVIPEYINESYNVCSPWDNQLYNITFKKPINFVDTRIVTTFIAILDTSGSMGESCSTGTGTESDGFTRLNLLQHSMNTLIEMLNPSDELVMIQFNSIANYIFNEKITQTNKSIAKSAIDSLVPGGGTYIWNGLKLAYDSASKALNTNVHIMLLTDGQSNDDPYSELKRYFERNDFANNLKSIKVTTFGFSYDINSKSLFDIAEYTNAGFNFIPDASMVGTTFCNYLANILSPDLTIPIITNINTNILSDNIASFDSLTNIQQYELVRYHCYQILKEMCIKSGTIKKLDEYILTRILQFKTWIQHMLLDSNSNSIYLQNMLKDFVSDDDAQEQITKAVQKSEWFNKWGYHYLLSLSLAHLTRQCHNFKDQGVQVYGSSIFKNLQDQVYQIFSTIPPPRPSLRAQVIRTSMSAYVDSSGGCFAPGCKIRLIDNTFIELNKLYGDELVYQGKSIPGSKIKYIIKTRIPSNQISMCKINDLIISDYHPMFDPNSNGWVFPNQLVNPIIHDMEYMYNIVLESGFWIEIEGFNCVSLGHGLTLFNSTNTILFHDFFGTQKVINDIEQFKINNDDKIIILENYKIIRDSNTNLVIKIEKN